MYPDLELGSFVMTKDYSAEWMDDNDHERICKASNSNVDLGSTFGYWSLRIVRKHLLSQVVEVFNFKDCNSKEYFCYSDKQSNFTCPFSDHSFEKEEQLSEHIVKKHPKDALKCNFCNFSLGTEKQLSDHISRNHHGNALKEVLLKELGWVDDSESITWTNQIYQVNENFIVGKLVSESLDKIITEQSGHVEKISENQEGYVIRYTLSTVAGSWIRDQD